MTDIKEFVTEYIQREYTTILRQAILTLWLSFSLSLPSKTSMILSLRWRT